MANSVPESALIEAAALQEAASVLPAGDPGRRALEQQAASLRSRGVKFLAADEDETEEQWARRMVKEAMRFPLKGPTRWYPIVLEIMTSLGAKRKGPPRSGYAVDASGRVRETLIISFQTAADSWDDTLNKIRPILRMLRNRVIDGSDFDIYVGAVDLVDAVISVQSHISPKRAAIINDLDMARKIVERAATGREEMLDIGASDGQQLYKYREFYDDIVHGREAPLTPDDTLLLLLMGKIDVLGLLSLEFVVSDCNVIYGNVAVATLAISSRHHGAADVVAYPARHSIRRIRRRSERRRHPRSLQEAREEVGRV